MKLPRLAAIGAPLALVCAVTLVACADQKAVTSPEDAFDGLRLAVNGAVELTEFEVCKRGTAATITVSVNGGAASPSAFLAGQCKIVHTNTLGATHVVRVTEPAQVGVVLDSIIVVEAVRVSQGSPLTLTKSKIVGSNTAMGRVDMERGTVVTFYNSAPPPPPSRGNQGCTPGYWKQSHHFDSWPAGYKPTHPNATRFNVALNANLFAANFTLLQALGQGGGGKNALGRQAGAAILNAASSGVDYYYTVAEVQRIVQAAVNGTLTYEQAKNLLEQRNERRCPLN